MTSQTSGPGRAAPSCAECGTPAEPGQSFCDSCGAVLGWAGSGRPGRTEPAGRPTAADTPARTRTPDGPGPGPDDRPGPTRGTGADDRPGGDGAAGRPRRGDTDDWPGNDDRTERPHRGDADDRPGGDGGTGRPRRGDTDDWPGATGRTSGTDDPGRAAAPRPRTGTADDGPRATAPASTTHADERTTAPEARGTAAPHDPYGHDDDGHDGRDPYGRDGDEGHDGRGDGADRTAGTPAAATAAPGRSPGHRGDRRDPAASPPADPYATSPDGDTEPLPHAAGSPRPSHHDDAAAAARARSLLVPVADPEPRAPDEHAVAPVLPGRPVAHRPQVRSVGPQADAEGGIPCPWCSTLNRPERHYCSRCAMSMTRGDDTPERLPWWRRMFGDRSGESAWAGDRPRLRRGFGQIWNWIVAAVVIGLVITLIVNMGAMIQATRDHFAKRAPIGPSSVKASRSYSEHGAALAFDKLNNTWWGPGISQSAQGEWLEASFDQPTRLLDLVITPGVSTKSDQLQESALPRQLEAQITLADGEKITRTITLDQAAGGQRRKFRVGEVTTVRFVLRSAYGADPKKQVAIAEIEFFGPSSNNT
ncbi:NADase-type glycan-binding domain-containing protein [Streptomyces prasinus]|uniref:NADase-type glycan-binding domain-containing protein n=1 Tax=Streptomyces prasinus TaxID=67345 RepID=UPI0037D267C8